MQSLSNRSVKRIGILMVIIMLFTAGISSSNAAALNYVLVDSVTPDSGGGCGVGATIRLQHNMQKTANDFKSSMTWYDAFRLTIYDADNNEIGTKYTYTNGTYPTWYTNVVLTAEPVSPSIRVVGYEVTNPSQMTGAILIEETLDITSHCPGLVPVVTTVKSVSSVVVPSVVIPSYSARLNARDVAAPAAIFPITYDDGVGLHFYTIGEDNQGSLALVVTPAEIAMVPDNPDTNTLIAASADGTIELYRLASGELQVNMGEYVIIFTDLIPDADLIHP
jgi:hypothetical protein